MENPLFIFVLILWGIIVCLTNLFPNNKHNIFLKKKIFVLKLFFSEWRVFSPIPVKSDLKLFYRDLKKDGTETKLKEIEYFSSKNQKFFSFSHRERVVFYRLHATEKKKSDAYIILKNCINEIVFKEEGDIRQICIVRTYGYYSDKKKKIELIDYI